MHTLRHDTREMNISVGAGLAPRSRCPGAGWAAARELPGMMTHAGVMTTHAGGWRLEGWEFTVSLGYLTSPSSAEATSDPVSQINT